MDTVVVALRVVLSLAVVLGLLWVLQRRLNRGAGSRAANVVTVVGRQGLGQKASVVVVDVDGRRFVLGVTEQSINVLHDAPTDAATAHAALAETDALTGTGVLTAEPADRSAAVFARSLHAVETADPLLRPRRDRGHSTGKLGGSILSPSTWQQTAALIRHGR